MSKNVQSEPMSKYKKSISIKLNTDIFGLLNLLKDELPLTRQKIANSGFDLSNVNKYEWHDEYIAPKIMLMDGAILNYAKLITMNIEGGIDIFFIFRIKNKMITRQELESQLGTFVVSYGDGLVNNAVITYQRKIGESYIFATYTSEPPNILLNVSFSSIEPLEQ